MGLEMASVESCISYCRSSKIKTLTGARLAWALAYFMHSPKSTNQIKCLHVRIQPLIQW